MRKITIGCQLFSVNKETYRALKRQKKYDQEERKSRETWRDEARELKKNVKKAKTRKEKRSAYNTNQAPIKTKTSGILDEDILMTEPTVGRERGRY